MAWPFTPLQPAETRTVQVKVRATSGEETDWSDPIDIYGAFLGDRIWQAKPIGHPNPADPAQPVLLRRTIHLRQPISHARLLWTAFGALDVEINGTAIDDSVLAPGWTSYHDRLIHETTDVTALLTTGENVIGINLAGAWYTEAYGFRGTAKRIYGDQPAALAQLEIDYADGSTETIATDETWLVTDGGPILASGIYAGETYDAARTIDGWSTPGLDPTLASNATSIATVAGSRNAPSPDHHPSGALVRADLLEITVSGRDQLRHGRRSRPASARSPTGSTAVPASRRPRYGRLRSRRSRWRSGLAAPGREARPRDDHTITVTATIPANTTAIIALPDRAEFEVAAGTHSWSYDEQPVERPPLTIDSSAAAVIDDEPAYRAVIAAIRRHDPDQADALQNTAAWPTGATMRTGLAFAPQELIDDVQRALTARP